VETGHGACDIITVRCKRAVLQAGCLRPPLSLVLWRRVVLATPHACCWTWQARRLQCPSDTALVGFICLTERLAAPARRSEPIELRPWVQRYARRRYGPATPPAAGAAWQLLLETVYNSTDLHNDHKCARAL